MLVKLDFTHQGAYKFVRRRFGRDVGRRKLIFSGKGVSLWKVIGYKYSPMIEGVEEDISTGLYFMVIIKSF